MSHGRLTAAAAVHLDRCGKGDRGGNDGSQEEEEEKEERCAHESNVQTFTAGCRRFMSCRLSPGDRVKVNVTDVSTVPIHMIFD